LEGFLDGEEVEVLLGALMGFFVGVLVGKDLGSHDG
jgi:hypothetical protein